MGATTSTPPSAVTAALARNRLGLWAVVFFVMSGVAPLTVAAGVVTTAYAVTGLLAIPIAFITVALVLGIFSIGYVAMARRVTNAGAFYAFITRGLGRSAGVAAAMVALVAYNLLQVGLYGAFGPAMADYASKHLHISAAWWVWSLGAAIVVAILGRLKVDLNGKVLAVLLSAEVVVVVVLTIDGLFHPANGVVSVATLVPQKLFGAGASAALVIAVLGYVGFEGAAVFSEEARNPRRTVQVATYVALGLIAVVYAGASWALAVHYGDANVAAVAQQQGPGMLFAMGGRYLELAGNTFYLTSLFAAMIAFHSFVTRYMFVLGREGVLPRVLEHTSRSGSPKNASLIQSLLGFAVIALYAAMGWDPLVKLFFWLGTTGGFGVLVLLAATSIAVIGYFLRTRVADESPWQRFIAPGLAAILLIVMVWGAVSKYATLLGVSPGSAPARWLPTLFVLAAAAGCLWAFCLRLMRPEVYEAIGAQDRDLQPTRYPARDLSRPEPEYRGIQL